MPPMSLCTAIFSENLDKALLKISLIILQTQTVEFIKCWKIHFSIFPTFKFNHFPDKINVSGGQISWNLLNDVF